MSVKRSIFTGGLALVLFFALYATADAASLRLAPSTGVYTVGNTFTVRVTINTAGQSVNAAEGRLNFNTDELSVVSASRASSIFNLWTEEPTYSNVAGTITFGGGSPNGYSGSNGTVMSVTFRALNAGTPRVTFNSGSVLAADGRGTNVLTNMDGASYTINAQSSDPEPETVYVPPANTPAAPDVTSPTHPDPSGWYTATTAELSWNLPPDATEVRTLLDTSPNTVPTVVYEDPIDSITLEDLDEGVSYFHIQFRNADGWGQVTHYRLAVDSEKPTSFEISQPEDQDPANPEQQLIFSVEDRSPITPYLIQLDGGDPIEFTDSEGTGSYTLTELSPGRHTVIVEAFDAAGNSLISTYAFTVASFDKPIFTEYPTRLNEGVIPVFRGTTRPNAEVTVSLERNNGDITTHTVQSGEDGSFTFIPDTGFVLGVYDITAVARDEYGAQSEPSDAIRIVVEQPGYIQIGAFVVSVLSIIVPLVALILLLSAGTWYLWHRLVLWRRRVQKETSEAETQLATEFDALTKNLDLQVKKLKKSRHGKLTKAEEALINAISRDIADARKRIGKEIGDIDDVIE